MDDKVKQFIELANELQGKLPKHNKPKMEFSKKIILGAFLFYAVMSLAGLAAWWFMGEWPQPVIDLVWPFGAIVVSYLGKSAYENKAKIQGKGGDNL